MTSRSAPALLAMVAVLCSSGCAIIPEVDDTPPLIELRISGPGVGSERMANPPMAMWTAEDGTQYLDLSSGSTYRFTLIVTDQGGVARASLAFPDSIVVSDLTGEGVVEEVSGINRRLTVRGDRSDPRRLLAFSGRLSLAGNSGLSFQFDGESTDFGGRSGTPNQSFLSVLSGVDL